MCVLRIVLFTHDANLYPRAADFMYTKHEGHMYVDISLASVRTIRFRSRSAAAGAGSHAAAPRSRSAEKQVAPEFTVVGFRIRHFIAGGETADAAECVTDCGSSSWGSNSCANYCSCGCSEAAASRVPCSRVVAATID